jgi:hypothetical protein
MSIEVAWCGDMARTYDFGDMRRDACGVMLPSDAAVEMLPWIRPCRR